MRIWDFARPGRKKREEERRKEKNRRREAPFKELGDSLQQVSPMTMMNDQVKNRIKALAKENSRQITLSLIEAGIYCAVFHELKVRLKRATRSRKYSGPAVKYVSDVMMPNGLYGPIFGFLIRLALPI